MSDDEKAIVLANTGEQKVNQSIYFKSELWPAEGCESSYDCELPQLSTTTPDSCNHPITKTNCELCSSGDENCLPPRQTLAAYEFLIEYAHLCGYLEKPYCGSGPMEKEGCQLEADTNEPRYCRDAEDCQKQIIPASPNTNTEKYPVKTCTSTGPDGLPNFQACSYTDYVCKSSSGRKVTTPFVFGLLEGDKGAYMVPAIGDPDSPKLQRRMFAMCRKCGDNTKGKCCDTTAYTSWKALNVDQRSIEMDRIYVKTKDYGNGPVATTRKYPFVWGADRGPSVQDDFRTYPPLFPALDPNDIGPDFCDIVEHEAPVGCAENITNIAAKRGRNVARRTIITPPDPGTRTNITMLRNGFQTCPPGFDIQDPVNCSSTPIVVKNGSYSQPKGCYSGRNGMYFSYGNGSTPIPDNVTALCYVPANTMDAPVVTCSQERFTINTSLMSGGKLPKCEDPTDWRCRFDCSH